MADTELSVGVEYTHLHLVTLKDYLFTINAPHALPSKCFVTGERMHPQTWIRQWTFDLKEKDCFRCW